MAGHTPYTPEQLAKAAEVFAATGNYTRAAEAIAGDVSAVRRALLARGEPDRTKLHARAIRRAERAGRAALGKNVARLEKLLAQGCDDAITRDQPPSMEPQHIAALSNALGNAVGHVADLHRALDARRAARLTRDKTRAETELVRARARALADLDAILAAATDEEFATLSAVVERIERRRRESGAGGSEGA